MKPQEPSSDYPLFAHAPGQWAKKINVKIHYFGPWDDPETARLRDEHLGEDIRNSKLDHIPKELDKFTTQPKNGKGKPTDPRGYPLHPHPSGQWGKKTRGQTHSFGARADCEAALRRCEAWREDLKAGRKHRHDPESNGFTVAEICSR